jgi:hypothetical protein
MVQFRPGIASRRFWHARPRFARDRRARGAIRNASAPKVAGTGRDGRVRRPAHRVAHRAYAPRGQSSVRRASRSIVFAWTPIFGPSILQSPSSSDRPIPRPDLLSDQPFPRKGDPMTTLEFAAVGHGADRTRRLRGQTTGHRRPSETSLHSAAAPSPVAWRRERRAAPYLRSRRCSRPVTTHIHDDPPGLAAMPPAGRRPALSPSA